MKSGGGNSCPYLPAKEMSAKPMIWIRFVLSLKKKDDQFPDVFAAAHMACQSQFGPSGNQFNTMSRDYPIPIAASVAISHGGRAALKRCENSSTCWKNNHLVSTSHYSLAVMLCQRPNHRRAT